MTKLMRRFRAVVALVTAPIMTGCSASYSGDGEFWLTNQGQGYHIRFEEFDMAQPFHAEYRLAGLPELSRGLSFSLQVTPAMQEDDELLGRYREGVLSLEALEKVGAVLFECTAPLTTWILGGVFTDGQLAADEFYYKPDEAGASIAADAMTKQPIVLKVTYEPAPAAVTMPQKLTGAIHAIGSIGP
jgi:hypothetical protein